MEGPWVELKGGYKMQASLYRKLTNLPLAPLFEGKDNFVCSDLSSDDDLPNPNYVHITMCSVPSTPESAPIHALSDATKEVGNLGPAVSEASLGPELNPNDVVSAAKDDVGNLGLELNPSDVVSPATQETGNLGFWGEKPPSPDKQVNNSEVVVVSSDDDKEEEESKSVEELSGDSEEEVRMEGTSVKLAGEASKSGSKPSPTAMECLIEMLRKMYETDEENVDILKTAKRKGITFPRNRGYDS